MNMQLVNLDGVEPNCQEKNKMYKTNQRQYIQS